MRQTCVAGTLWHWLPCRRPIPSRSSLRSLSRASLPSSSPASQVYPDWFLPLSLWVYPCPSLLQSSNYTEWTDEPSLLSQRMLQDAFPWTLAMFDTNGLAWEDYDSHASRSVQSGPRFFPGLYSRLSHGAPFHVWSYCSYLGLGDSRSYFCCF